MVDEGDDTKPRRMSLREFIDTAEHAHVPDGTGNPASSTDSPATSPSSLSSPSRRKDRIPSSPSSLRRLQKKGRKWDPNDPHELWKFAEAQKEFQAQAIEEISEGKKKTHWMWFIIPTPPHMSGDCEVGSPTNRFYALRDDGAVAYLKFRQNGVDLRQNYIEILSAVRDQLKAGKSTTSLLGAADGPKLQSSAAFFERIAKQQGDTDVECICREVLTLTAGESSSEAKRKGQPESLCCCVN